MYPFTLSHCLYRYGIRVNAILPGFIETPMINVVPEKVVERMKVLIPQGRLGKPEGKFCAKKKKKKS